MPKAGPDMCSICGYPSAPGHWTEAGAATAHDRIRARFRRAAVLKSVLASYGVSAHDDGHIPGIQLSTFSGNTMIVPNLESVWAAVEKLTGNRVDPLDPRFTRPVETNG